MNNMSHQNNHDQVPHNRESVNLPASAKVRYGKSVSISNQNQQHQVSTLGKSVVPNMMKIYKSLTQSSTPQHSQQENLSQYNISHEHHQSDQSYDCASRQ